MYQARKYDRRIYAKMQGVQRNRDKLWLMNKIKKIR